MTVTALLDRFTLFLEGVQEDYLFLTEEEIDNIRCGVDSNRIVRENEGCFYNERDVDDVQKGLNEGEYIEGMFNQLL